MLNAKSILSLSIFVIFKLIYTVSTFSRTRHSIPNPTCQFSILFLVSIYIHCKQNPHCLMRGNGEIWIIFYRIYLA